MPGIFISYRREDSSAYAGRLFDRLANHFGKDNVFMDIDSIEPGLDFVEVLEGMISKCDAVVVVIGKQWLAVTDSDGRRRLDNPEDLVRLEVATALERKIRVVPALVGGARMPSRHELPQAISVLARRNALEITDLSFHQSVTRLIEALDKKIPKAQPLPASVPVPEQVLGLSPTLTLNDQPAFETGNPFNPVPLFLRILLLYRPQGDADWVSWAWVCRIVFALSSLSFVTIVILVAQFHFEVGVVRAWLFFLLMAIVPGSRLAASWCEIQARKNRAPQTRENPYLYVPRWRRTFLLYLPHRGASGWVFMGWVSRILVLLSGAFSFTYFITASSFIRTDPWFWVIFFVFVAATVLLRFIASWFDKLAARSQTQDRKPALRSGHDAQ